MGSVYFIRHGQTVWNVQHRIAGVTDVELTEEGYRQARAAAEELRNSGIRIDEIWSSPLRRASETARILSEATGIPWRSEPRLKEQNFGRWEGKAQRVYDVLDELKQVPDRTRILVAHNGIARVVRSYFEEMTNEEFARWTVPNCRLMRFDYP